MGALRGWVTMSSWYSFGLACDLREDTPPTVLALLKYLAGLEDDDYVPPSENSLPFDIEAYRSNFINYGPFHQFPGAVGAVLQRTWRNFFEGGESGDRYTFSFHCEMHEDEFGEQSWTFVKWLAPYTETEGIGYFYSKLSTTPTPFYFRDGKAEFYEVELKHIGTLDKDIPATS
ncbi:MAG: hypothetical protein R2932_08150 [Caldilineaceae bacterium]